MKVLFYVLILLFVTAWGKYLARVEKGLKMTDYDKQIKKMEKWK